MARKQTTALKKASERAVTVGFRLGEPYYSRLASEAQEKGVSVHALARLRLTDALDRDEALGEEMRATREAVERVGETVAKATEQVLLTLLAPEGAAPDEALKRKVRAWVDTHLRERE